MTWYLVTLYQVESCTYALGFPLGNPVPRWFRQALRKLSPDDLRRFLIAVIHSPSLPRDTFGMAQVRVVRVVLGLACPTLTSLALRRSTLSCRTALLGT